MLFRSLIGVYILNDSDVIFLDSGTAFGCHETRLINEITQKAGMNVKAVIATHGHLDHIGNNEMLSEKFGTKIYMYGSEGYLCNDMDSLRMQHTLVPFDGAVEEACKHMKSHVDYRIEDNADHIIVEDEVFGIVHTPGHSISHIAIITPDNVCMVGDALMTEAEIRKTKIPYACNFAIDFATKRKLLELECDKYIIAHRGVRDDLEYEVEMNINYLKERAEIILTYIEDGMTYDDVAAAVIKCMNIKIHNRFFFFDIYGMIMPYVQYLEESGKIEGHYNNGYVRYKVMV